MKKGWFITFEGPDGCGKTTVSKGVYQKFLDYGYDAIYTREPGGIDIAEQIRNVILDPKNTAMDEKTEALLYAASRRQHLVEKVLPALEKKQLIICDRFIDSSLAYQGIGRGIGIDKILSINEFAIEGHLPDKTIYLDIDAETGLKRIQNREFKDRLDQEDISFHVRVCEGYKEIVERFADRMICIDANKGPEAIIEEAFYQIKKLVD